MHTRRYSEKYVRKLIEQYLKKLLCHLENIARIGGEFHPYRGCIRLDNMKEYIPRTTGEYDDDYCRCAKRHWKLKALDDVVEKLCRGERLGRKYHDHKLSGKWKGCRECHINGDWVLVYRKEDQYLILRRTGSHDDVFGR